MKVVGLILFLAAVYAKHEQYEGWKSFFLKPSDADQVKILHSVAENLELDFLTYPRVDYDGVVLVKPQFQADFLDLVSRLNIEHRIHSDDVKRQLDIDDQLVEEKRLQTRARNARSLPYDNYQSLEAIYDYLDEIAAKYPDRVTLVEPANSFEGRPIKYLKISTTNFEDESKPVIFIDGGMHSREWISPPTVTYAIHKLVENVTESDLVENYDWILLPMVNPDGYKHSFEVSRFWRKTRSTDQHSLSAMCPGVDGNRNFDFAWNTVGTSNNPCTDTYAGSRAFSEVEARVVDEVLRKYLHRIVLYLTMHSYGSMMLYPWGHDGTLSHHAFALHTVGISMADAIYEKTLPHFPRYQVGNSALVIQYLVSGAAEDYAHSIGVPLSYTYELPGFGLGMNGFVLDPQYIEPVCEETWAGISVGARLAAQYYGKK